MTKVNDLHRKWMKNKEYRKAHEDLAPEFALARAVISARVTAGLTQSQLAQRMHTTQSVIARAARASGGIEAVFRRSGCPSQAWLGGGSRRNPYRGH